MIERNGRIDRNTMASLLVINAVSTFPQSPDARVLVAEKLMRGMVDPKYKNSITIMEMANISPDIDFCTQKIEAMHSAHGIVTVLKPDRVARVVRTFAFEGINYIRTQTINQALISNVEIDEDLIFMDGLYDPAEINIKSAEVLSRYLKNNPSLTINTANRIKIIANRLLSYSKDQIESQKVRMQNKLQNKSLG